MPDMLKMMERKSRQFENVSRYKKKEIQSALKKMVSFELLKYLKDTKKSPLSNSNPYEIYVMIITKFELRKFWVYFHIYIPIANIPGFEKRTYIDIPECKKGDF